ncbi:hypothetical protein DPEC_G00188500 [Dallia pectoralis]|uniref:Uncharacterized protein n=1 Tax=Dallia pectoralis TaxID=75939 RepID=A0ACC2GCA6_DALPE|nr:hypothetical protein DPEC_G00188500 [Dallia pectoralis]
MLKRKVPTDPAEEDLKIKRRMLELMEDSSRRDSDNMLQINTNIANITSTIQEGFSFMRELLFQRQFTPPHSSRGQHQHHTLLHQPSCTHIGPMNQQTNLDSTTLNSTHLHHMSPHISKHHFHTDVHCCKMTQSDCPVALYNS